MKKINVLSAFILGVICVVVLISQEQASSLQYGLLLLASVMLYAHIMKDILEILLITKQSRKRAEDLDKINRNREIYAPQQVFAPAPAAVNNTSEKPWLSVQPPKKREDTVSYVKREDTIAYSTIAVEPPMMIPVDISSSSSNDYSSSSDNSSSSSDSGSSDYSGGGGDYGGGGASGSWD